MIDDPHADVIIRSSDSVDFRVRKAILSEVSAFFEDLFSLPQVDTDSSSSLSNNSGPTVDGLPVIPVAENEKTLSLFLR